MAIGAASTAGVGAVTGAEKKKKYVSREGISGPAKSRIIKRREMERGVWGGDNESRLKEE